VPAGDEIHQRVMVERKRLIGTIGIFERMSRLTKNLELGCLAKKKRQSGATERRLRELTFTRVESLIDVTHEGLFPGE